MNDPTPTAETRPEAHKPVDYRSFGRFDRKIFLQGFWRAFRGRGLGSGALGDVQTLLGLMERDAAVTDIRWMAYMFATVLKETTHPEARQVRVLDRKHRPVLDKNGQPMTRTVRPWVVTMAPVAEVGHGAGRRYHEPVKVLRLEDGSVRVTEIDGDRFSVSKAGVILPLTPKADLGARDGAPHAQVYDDDPGTPLCYYGRGYVQLTWWSNYAKAGVALGRSLELLLDPEKVEEPATAYGLMSYGMRTGFGFANGRKFVDYFGGRKTNYVGARAMVNGHNCAEEIARFARQFERIQLAARTR